MAWKADNYSDYAAHNIRQTEKIISELKSVYGSIDGGGRYSYLFRFVDNVKKDMKRGNAISRTRGWRTPWTSGFRD